MGAWGAAIYGVAQSRTRLKQLSSSSSSTKAIKKLVCLEMNVVWTPQHLMQKKANIPGIAKFPDNSERLAPPLRTAEKGPWLLMLPKRREGFIHL